MAVTHCMNCVLALSIPLAEEALSEAASFGEGGWIGGIAEVHHLIDDEERLIASLLPLPEFLKEKRYNFNLVCIFINLI